MSAKQKYDLCLRLFWWAHKAFVKEFHAVSKPDRVEQMHYRYAIIKRVRVVCVKYGVLHPDVLALG